MSLRDCYADAGGNSLASHLFVVDTGVYNLEEIARNEHNVDLTTGIVSCVLLTKNDEENVEAHTSCFTLRAKSIYEADFSDPLPFMFLDCGYIEMVGNSQNTLFLHDGGSIYRIGACRNSLSCYSIRRYSWLQSSNYCSSNTAWCNELNLQYPPSTVSGSTTTLYRTESTSVYEATSTYFNLTSTVTQSPTHTVNVTSTQLCPKSTNSLLYSSESLDDILPTSTSVPTISNLSCTNSLNNYESNYHYIHAAAVVFIGMILGSLLAIAGIFAIKSEIFKVPELVNEVNSYKDGEFNQSKAYTLMARYYKLSHLDYQEACRFSSKNLLGRIYSHIVNKIRHRKLKDSINKVSDLPYEMVSCFEEAVSNKYNKKHSDNIKNLAAEAACIFTKKYDVHNQDDVCDQIYTQLPHSDDIAFISSYCNSREITSKFNSLQIEHIKKTYFIIMAKIRN